MIIFNLDGTLAECEHRMHLVYPEKYRQLCECSNYRIIDGKPVLDLDGKTSWRYKETGEPFQHGLKAFDEACDKDKPIESTIKAINHLYSLDYYGGNEDVYIWSGRCESVIDKTEKWLEENSVNYPYQHLKMRPIGNTYPECDLKEKWLQKLLAKGEKVHFVFESDPDSIHMFRRYGIFVFDCRQKE